MTERERLIEILSKTIYAKEGVDPAEVVADYLLDNGVIVPPCKVGDKVYFLGICKTAEDFGKVYVGFGEIWSISRDKDGFRFYVSTTGALERFTDCDFGKTVFLTEEEAEKALKERKGE